jgi:uncharacterized protein YjeT (DUF2065 family)
MLASGAVDPWTLLFAALGVAMFVEGLPYFVAPRAVRVYLERLARMSDASLRSLGLGMMSLGLVVAYFTLH